MTFAPNKYHQEILRALKSKAKKGSKHGAGYVGTNHLYYNIDVPTRRKIVKKWLKKHQNLSTTELVALIDSLSKGKSHEEISIRGLLLEYLPRLRWQIAPRALDRWLDKVEGWAEVDSLCQSNFTAEEMTGRWKEWESLIGKLARDKNIHKRRASLVLLTLPVRHSDDRCLAELAFEIIDRLKSERNILITKAISWLLRSLIDNHKRRLEDYLLTNEQLLPKIAVRETKRKLLTGKK